MFIPKELKDQIVNAVDIVDIIGRFVVIKKKGANYIGSSPWQAEKTPSFNVVVSKQIFKDFSSGNGGDVIKFLMIHPDTLYTFTEAIEYLAKEAGIDIPKPRERKANEPKVFRDRLIEVNQWVCQYFESKLRNDGSEEPGSAGLEYLTLRGVSDHIIRQFRLGFALESFNALFKAAKANGFNNVELQYAGVINYSKKVDQDGKRIGKYYDTYRNRVMFPIMDAFGNVITFGGRVIGDATDDRKSEGKYLNGRTNTLHKKSRVLYGINLARNQMRISGEAILVEGYLDVIALHQAKVSNAVGSLGTAFTKYHADEILKYCTKVNIIFDADSAGLKASKSAIEILLGEGLEVFITVLPKDEDPSSFLASIPYPAHLQALFDTAFLNNTPLEFTAGQLDEIEVNKGKIFNKYLEDKKQGFLQYLLQQDYLTAPTSEQKAKVVKRLIYTISKINDPGRRTELCKEMSAVTWHDVDYLKEQTAETAKKFQDEFYARMNYKKQVYRVGKGESELFRLYMVFGDTIMGETTLGDRILADLDSYQYEFVDKALDNLYTVITSLRAVDIFPTVETVNGVNKRAGETASSVSKKFKLQDFSPAQTSVGYDPHMCIILNNYKKWLIKYRLSELEKKENMNPIERQMQLGLLRKLQLFK
jgi:DNA primase catalytic core